MSHDLFDEQLPGPRPKGGLYIFVVLLVIGGMLGSGIYATIWFISRAAAENTTAAATALSATPTEDSGRQNLVATEAAPELAQKPEPLIPEQTETPINRIVYIRQDGQVATIAADGSDERVLTRTSHAYQFPAWSPDGQFLAVVGSDLSGSGIYLLTDTDQPTETPWTLYYSRNETPFYLYWSPDSRQVSFLANFPGSTLGLHIVSITPGDNARLIATGSPLYWDWAAESDQILIHSGFAGEASRLAMLDTTADAGEKVIAQPGFFQAPGISANGRYLAYAEEVSAGLSELIIADTETGVTQRQRHAGLVAFGWNPAGDQLAAISSAGRADEFYGPLRLIEAQSGEMRLVSREVVVAFFWSPDGQYLAVISLPRVNNDLNAQQEDLLPGKTPNQLARMSGQWRSAVAKSTLQQPEPLLFDLSIIEVESGESRYHYPFEPTRIFVNQFLLFFDQYALSHQLWSPGSDALVLPMRFDGEDTVFVVFANGAHPVRLADGNMPFWSRE